MSFSMKNLMSDYAECIVLLIVMLNVVMLNVFVPNVIMLNVVVPKTDPV